MAGEMESNPDVSDLDRGLVDTLSPARQRLLAIQADFETAQGFETVFEEVLSDEQRQLLGGDWQAAWADDRGTIGTLSHIWQCSRPEAFVRLLELYQSLPPVQIQKLRKELQLPENLAPAADSLTRPDWNKQAGKLIFR